MHNKIQTPNNLDKNHNESVAHKVADTMREKLDHAGDVGAKMADTLQEKTAQAQDKAQKLGESVADAASQLSGDVTSMIKSYPWAVTGGAIALGFLIGALSRNR